MNHVSGRRHRVARLRAVALLVLLGAAVTVRAGAVALPSIAVTDTTVTEGNSGTVNATFVVSLSQASDQAVSVHFSTADGSATAPGDYESTSGTLSFAAGETSRTVTVKVKHAPSSF